MTYHFVMTGLLFLAVSPLAAQSPSELSGRVLDATTGYPIAGAEAEAQGFTTGTAESGRFLFGSLAPGRVVVRVRAVGYAPASQALDLLPGLSADVEFRLAPRVVELDSIAVLSATNDDLKVSGEALRRRGRDLGHALEGWEGITIRRGAGGEAQPQVRGSSPDEVLVVLDGFSINDPYTGRADLSRIPTEAIESVTLSPGAQGPRAGSRAVAGVIAVETRRRFPPQATGTVASFGGADLTASGSLGPASLFLAHSWLPDGYSYDVPPARGSGEADRQNAGGGVWSFNARVRGDVELVARGSASDRGLPGPVTNPTPTASAKDRSVLLGLRTEKYLEATGSLQWLAARYLDPSPAVGPAYDGSTEGLAASGSAGFSKPVDAAGLSGRAGAHLEGRHDRFSGDAVADNARFSYGAVRLDARVVPQWATSLSLAPVVRLDLWTGLSDPMVSARLDLGWQHQGTSLTLGLGNGVTPPVMADLFFREGNGVRVNPDLRPERVAWQFDLGARQEARVFGARTAFSLRGYAGRIEDMVLWGLSPAYGFVWTPRNLDVNLRGGEAALRISPVHAFSVGGSASLSHVTSDAPDNPQILYRPEGTAAADVLWQPGHWSFDARWHFVGVRYPNSAGINPLPSFSIFDAGAERSLGRMIRLRAQMSDLTDTRAEFISGFPSPGRSVSVTLTVEMP